MRAIIYPTSLIIVVFMLVSCASPPTNTSVTPLVRATNTSTPAEHSPTNTPQPTPTAFPVPSPTAPPSNIASPTPEVTPVQLTQYRIDAALNYGQHLLSVEQQIIYTNHYNEPLPDLLLLVEAARYPATFTLKEITWQDGQPIEDFSRELGLIRIPLEQFLEPGETAGLSLSYDLDIPSPSPSYYGRPVPFGYSSRQTNLVDWYPFIPPYQPGQGWVAHQPGAFGEHLVYEVADFDVNISLDDNNPNLVIAASAPGALVDGRWQYHLNNARNFSWSVSDQYVLSTTTVDSVLVMSYYFPLDSQPGEAVLQTTAESLALFNDLFGPYPRQTLTVVEADFLDGMEYDGLYFLSKGFYNLYSGGPGDYLTAIAAHETAHQWWYSAVGNDQALEPWLDEALSTFSEKVFYEKVQPQALDWWWTYRIDYYDPRGWVDGSIYNPLGYRAYRDAVYLNGANFLDDLSTLIGDEAFLNFLGAYAREYSLQISSADNFFALLSNYSQEDLQPLVDQYFEKR
jgi:hypothetical protein